ncbi:MAG: S1 RNA-binding domain-containing protein, partial [bacterium]
ITTFGAFLDLGGVDGLLHITDISWTKIDHPSEVLKIGDKIKVKILDFNRETGRVTVGLKQLTPSPWEVITSQIQVGGRVKGKVTRVKSYGAFVDLGMGIEGLIHSSQFSWVNPNVDPTKIVKVGAEIEAVVLGVDNERKRISLGVKQLTPDPWENIEERYPVNSIRRGKVKNMTSFGVFVELEDGIEGLIHISDLSWTKRILHPSEILRRGQTINVMVLKIDKENRRISLGLKQIEKDPWPELAQMYAVGNETEGKIIRIMDKGVIVELPGGAEGFVPVAHLGKKVNKPSEAFSIGDLLPLKVIEFDKIDRRIILSVSAYFESKRKEDLEKYLAEHPTKAFLVEELTEKPVIFPDEEEKTKEPSEEPQSFQDEQ